MLKPLFTNVILKKATQQSSLGIILPTNNNLFEVVAIGPSVEEVELEDLVYIKTEESKPFSYQGVDYLVIAEKNILLIVKE